MGLLRILLVAFVLGCGVPLAAVVSSTVAMADDGDGDGDGGGGGGGGSDSSGGGEAWQPPANRPSSNQRLRCRCGGFLGLQCSCRMVGASGGRSTRPAPTSELVAIGLNADDLAALTARGFRPVGSRQSVLLGQSVSRIQPPRRVSFRRALALARSTVPGRTFAANDLYPTARPVFRPAGTLCGQGCPAFQLTNWRADVGRCAAQATIGVIDTGVDSTHPAFATSRIETVTIRGEDRAPSGRDHGTGVVSLLVGDAGGEFSGAAPGARVVAVDAFHGGTSGDIADTYDLVAAIDLLVERRIKVINLSLSGPDNPLLRDVVAKATAAGTIIVAAAGTSQGGTQSGFPARYPGVLAVSGIDGRLRAASGSQRGDHIAFSAPGVGISVANAKKGYSTVRGSSFAAPFVSAAYAMALETVRDGEQATRLIASAAKDLGAPGRDGVFGWGLIQFTALPSC